MPTAATDYIDHAVSHTSTLDANKGEQNAPDHEATLPEFGGDLDPHHLVPAIAFGHAAQFPLP